MNQVSLKPIINPTTKKLNYVEPNVYPLPQKQKMYIIYNQDKCMKYIGFTNNLHSTLIKSLIKQPCDTYYFSYYNTRIPNTTFNYSAKEIISNLIFNRNCINSSTIDITSPIKDNRYYFKKAKSVGLTMIYITALTITGGIWLFNFFK